MTDDPAVLVIALTAEIERLNRYTEQLRANAEHDANEIEQLNAKIARRDFALTIAADNINARNAEVERLTAENTDLRTRAQEFYEYWVKTRDALETVSAKVLELKS